MVLKFQELLGPKFPGCLQGNDNFVRHQMDKWMEMAAKQNSQDPNPTKINEQMASTCVIRRSDLLSVKLLT